MLKKYQHKDSIPSCCKDCFHCRKISPNSDHMKCVKGRIMPRKKNKCNIQKLNIKKRFFQFLREHNIINMYHEEWRCSERWDRVLTPVCYLDVFKWVNGRFNLWSFYNKIWLAILKKEYGVTP